RVAVGPGEVVVIEQLLVQQCGRQGFGRDAEGLRLLGQFGDCIVAEGQVQSAVRHAGMIAEVAACAYVFSTKLSITFFSPAFSNSTTSLLPSTARMAPYPNF